MWSLECQHACLAITQVSSGLKNLNAHSHFSNLHVKMTSPATIISCVPFIGNRGLASPIVSMNYLSGFKIP